MPPSQIARKAGISITLLNKLKEVYKYEIKFLDKYIERVYGNYSKVNRKEYILTPIKLLHSSKLTPMEGKDLEEYDTFPYYGPMK